MRLDQTTRAAGLAAMYHGHDAVQSFVCVGSGVGVSRSLGLAVWVSVFTLPHLATLCGVCVGVGSSLAARQHTTHTKSTILRPFKALQVPRHIAIHLALLKCLKRKENGQTRPFQMQHKRHKNLPFSINSKGDTLFKCIPFCSVAGVGLGVGCKRLCDKRLNTASLKHRFCFFFSEDFSKFRK